MKIVATADTHFPIDQDMMYKEDLLLPDGDVLVIAGDLMYNGNEAEWYKRVEALGRITKYQHKLFVPGNHDLYFQYYSGPAIQEMRHAGVHCLTPTRPVTIIDGVKFAGCPFVTGLPNWAYNADEDCIWGYLDSIGSVDVMIAHSPPRGVLDSDGKGSYGTSSLRKYIHKFRPTIVICGHVHEGYGFQVVDHTQVFNAAMCNVDYQQVNKAHVIEI